MSEQMTSMLGTVAAQFELAGAFAEGRPYGTGHINDTYAISVTLPAGGHRRYILQRVNHSVFRNVPALMDNIRRVTAHIAGKLAKMPGHDPGRETLTVVPSLAGKPYWLSPDGNYWRVYDFIEQARTFDEVTADSQAYEAARAFARFQGWLMDLPAPPLTETIPDFHHTPRRFETFRKALDADPEGRAAEAKPEIAFALERASMTHYVVDRIAEGVLPLRTTHNDTKINNVMINDADGRGICVIDLDTVMPGSVLYDFGDQVRTTTGTAAEDETDLSRVQFRLDRFRCLVEGYLEGGRTFLLPAEIDGLALSGRLITFEIGLRFLTDFLEGDVYFKTHRPGHNLDRARTQFEMVRQMEVQSEQMEAIVAACR